MAQNETGKIYRFIYKILFKHFNVTPISISKKVLESVQAIYGKEFQVLIENGVKQPILTKNLQDIKNEINSYKLDKSTNIFLNIGRISHQKNHKMLVKVFSDLISEGKNIVLVIIGQDTTENKEYEKVLLQIKNKNIHLLGMKANIADYLSCSDAFCLSSLYEGLPITLLESLAMGTVPICTPAGGIPDVINNDTGFIAKDYSYQSFKKEIIDFLKMPYSNKENKEIECKKLYLLKYSIGNTANNYTDLYCGNVLK